jgi:hypothetical protein
MGAVIGLAYLGRVAVRPKVGMSGRFMRGAVGHPSDA